MTIFTKNFKLDMLPLMYVYELPDIMIFSKSLKFSNSNFIYLLDLVPIIPDHLDPNFIISFHLLT